MKRALPMLFLIALALLRCGGTASSQGGGTSVSNPPTLPESSFAPDFDDNIFETAITSNDASASESLVSHLTAAEPVALTGPASEWEQIFLSGPVARTRALRDTVAVWGERLAALAAGETLGETSIPLLVEDVRLIDRRGDWRVNVSVRDETLIRAVVRNPDDGLIWAYYLLETGDDGEPSKGAFSYVNPRTLGSNAVSGVRFFGLAFDFSDPSSNRLSLTLDIYDDDLARFAVLHLVYECDETTRDCSAELLRIVTAPPERSFNASSARLSWNDDSREICIATVSYGDETTFGETQSFVGPEAPDDAGVASGTCALSEPFWTGRNRSPSDLPARQDDDSEGGYAATLFGDGSSESPWEDRVTSDAVSDWLSGVF